MKDKKERQTAGRRAAAEYLLLCRRRSYGLCLIGPGGDVEDADTIGVGQDLVEGVKREAAGLMPGCYAVRARTYLHRRRLPDWGTLVIRPRGWVLRSRIGRLIVPDGCGGVIWLGPRGGGP